MKRVSAGRGSIAPKLTLLANVSDTAPRSPDARTSSEPVDGGAVHGLQPDLVEAHRTRQLDDHGLQRRACSGV